MDKQTDHQHVYEQWENEIWVDKIALGRLSPDLAPSGAMQENSSKAAAMGSKHSNWGLNLKAIPSQLNI